MGAEGGEGIKNSFNQIPLKISLKTCLLILSPSMQIKHVTSLFDAMGMKSKNGMCGFL